MNTAQKEFVVWYEGGAGGFFVGWLLNIAIDPSLLELGLAVFPTELEKNAGNWKKFEQTPPHVGILCNMFFPESASNYQQLTNKEAFDQLLTALQTTGQQPNDLLHLRSKFFLVNYILKSSNATEKIYGNIDFESLAEKYPLSTFKHITDTLFDFEKNIFLISPKEYTQLACQCKHIMYIESDIEKILSNYNNIKTFKIESIWKNYWQAEIETILSRSMTAVQQNACDALVKRYMQVMPKELLEFCYAD